MSAQRVEHHVPGEHQARIRIPCPECDGRGLYSIVNSMDPSAKLYECEECGGDGFLEVEAEEIEA